MSGGLKRSTLFYYSLTDMPVMMSIFPAIVFIPRYYASEVGVSLAMIGTILLVVRWLDVLTDPLMGFISDRTRSRFGRRRPWVLLAAPVLMLSIYRLYMPPEGADGWYMFIWSVVMSVGTTMMLIPYYAWGAELSPDYNERSRITGLAGRFRSVRKPVGPGCTGRCAVVLRPRWQWYGAGTGGHHHAHHHAALCPVDGEHDTRT